MTYPSQKLCRKSRRVQNMRGQVILISVIMLSSAIMSATAVAGILTAYQIRQANDAIESTKAFFAADAGIEKALYCYFYESPILLSSITQGTPYCVNNNESLGGSTKYSSYLTFRFNPSNQPVGFTVNANGDSGKVQRELETRITTKFGE